MSKNDEALVRAGDLAVSLSLLTRLPVPGSVDITRKGRAAWAYPLAGFAVAMIAGAAGIIGDRAGLEPAFNALIILSFLIFLTGAMHEDGLADSADGLWGGWDREKRLEIMKDSHIGTYGVIAIFLSLSWRYAAIFMLCSQDPTMAFYAVLAAALLSRATMPALMLLLPNARASGLSHSVGAVPRLTVALAVLLACLGATFLLGSSASSAIAGAVFTTACVAVIARRKIGGQTGDILGAAQQLAEIAVLTSLVS